MSDTTNLDVEHREATVLALLDAHPDAPIAAVDDALFVPLPDGFPVGGHRTVSAATPLELVPEDEVPKMLAVWIEAKAKGVARVVIHLAEDEGRPYVLHLIDLRERWGVFIGIGVPTDDAAMIDEAPSPTEPVSAAPRFTRLVKNLQAVITDVDEAFATMLGWEPDDVVGTRTVDFVHPDDVTPVVDAWLELLAQRSERRLLRLRHRRKDGTYAWLDVANRIDGPDQVVCDMVDVSEEMAALHAAWERQQVIDQLASALPLGVAQLDRSGRIIYTNERLQDILGLDAAQLDAGLPALLGDDWPRVNRAVRAVLTAGADQHLAATILPPGGEARFCEITWRPLHDESGTITGAVAAVDDTTARARLELELEDRATFDALTGCHNRTSVIGVLDVELGAIRATDGLAVVFVDLDTFKAVNDRLGHAAGDEVLRAAAGRIRVAVRDQDLVGRFGGDEFLVVCPAVADTAEAMRIAARIAELLHGTVPVDGDLVEVRASVGVAWTSTTTDAARLVAEADTAMYESKRQGAGRPVLYQARLERSGARGVDDEQALRRALRTGDLEVHYQPIVQLADGATVGYEALLRWRRDGRVVAAGEFIELAEKSGLIHEIGAWVIDQVCGQAAAVAGTPSEPAYWTVNASPLQIAAAGLADALRESVARHGVAADKLIVEVTEHEALGRSSAVHATLASLDTMGIRLAIDDFGTGWSSLELLMALAVDCIKIPRQFTMQAVANERSRRLIELVVAAARDLGATVVVEGIETEVERALMARLGVDHGQGWLFARARPAHELFRSVSPLP